MHQIWEQWYWYVKLWKFVPVCRKRNPPSFRMTTFRSCIAAFNAVLVNRTVNVMSVICCIPYNVQRTEIDRQSIQIKQVIPVQYLALFLSNTSRLE